MTFDTKGLLVEAETGVEGVELVNCDDEVGSGVGDEEEVEGLFVFVAATERRPEVSCAVAKCTPTQKLAKRKTRRYMTKS